MRNDGTELEDGSAGAATELIGSPVDATDGGIVSGIVATEASESQSALSTSMNRPGTK